MKLFGVFLLTLLYKHLYENSLLEGRVGHKVLLPDTILSGTDISYRFEQKEKYKGNRRIWMNERALKAGRLNKRKRFTDTSTVSTP